MDSNTKQKQEQEDVFNKLPDHLLHLIFNKIHDAKSLTTFLSVSKRFNAIIPTQTNAVSLTLPLRHCRNYKNTHHNLNNHNNHNNSNKSTSSKHNYHINRFINKLFLKPLKSLIKFATRKTSCSHCNCEDVNSSDLVKHALTNFQTIKSLNIELPGHGGDIEIMEPNLLKWKAEFGTKLENGVIFGATSSYIQNPNELYQESSSSTSVSDSSSYSSYFSDDELKVRVVWVISCLMEASSRHYMVKEVVKNHKDVENVVITDGSRQGKICMDKRQVDETRESEHGPDDVSSERSKVPSLRMKMWYVPELEVKMQDGSVMVLKGATLVVVRPKEDGGKRVSYRDLVKGAFSEEDEIFGEAAMKMVKKKKIYTLEMNSF